MDHSSPSPCVHAGRRRGALRLGILCAALLLPAAAHADTLVVDADGTYDAGTNDCAGGDPASTTINAANAAAVDGDTILVCPGIYNESQIDITKALTFQGSGADVTIIDAGGGTGLVNAGTIRIRTTTGDVTFDGFTVRNPAAQGASPSGVRYGFNVKSSSPVTYTITNNVIEGTNDPTMSQDYGIYANGPAALETLIFQYNVVRNTGSNPILIEQHVGPTDVSFNTFDRGVSQNGVSAYFNMSHSGVPITSLQRVSNNVIDLANDPGPYSGANASSGIVFFSAFGGSLGTFSNVEITGNTITNVEDSRRAIALTNGAAAPGTDGEISNAVISCNAISGPGAANSVGIRLLGLVTNPSIVNNDISGVATGLLARDNSGHIASGIVLNENGFSAIGARAIDWWGTTPFDAELNWYDSASGPTEPSNPGGTGAAIGASGGPVGAGVVDYEPWLGSDADADAGTCFVPGDSAECVGVSTCDVANGCSAPPKADGDSCDDGLYCNGADTCLAGTCSVHTGDPCAGGLECANVCDEGGDTCNVAAGTACSDDGEICSADVCDGSGACTHPAGNAGTECRAPGDACEAPAVCDGVSTVCPANPLLPDGDGDGDCDAVDVCTNVGGGQVFESKPKSRLVLSKINTDATAGNDGLTISAFFTLPAGHSFAEIEPDLQGVRVVLLAQDGTPRLDVAVPGGLYDKLTKVGWKRSGNGKAWRFTDRSASPTGGINQVVINDKNTTKTPRRVKVLVKGKKSTYPVTGPDAPVQAIVTLGDDAAAAAGLCGESAYVAADCRLNP
ncbi:MAG: hypothetical protein AB1689_08170, partial [Thermodesulfobacteriota bacterium]